MNVLKLISRPDFLPYHTLSNNTDDAKRLDAYIYLAQKMDLAPLLGANLYFDLLKYTASLLKGRADAAAEQPPVPYVPTDAEVIFERLLHGVEYTIHAGSEKEVTKIYEGIVPVLVFFSYARLLRNDNTRHTPSGFVDKKTLESEPISAKTLEMQATASVSDGNIFMQSVRQYISDQKYIADGAAEWFKRYGNECCGGGHDHGCGCSGTTGRAKGTPRMKGIKNPNRLSRGFNPNER